MTVYYLNNTPYIYNESVKKFYNLSAVLDGRKIQVGSHRGEWEEISRCANAALDSVAKEGKGAVAAQERLQVTSTHVHVASNDFEHGATDLFQEFERAERDKARIAGAGVSDAILSAVDDAGEEGVRRVESSFSSRERSASLSSVPTVSLLRSPSAARIDEVAQDVIGASSEPLVPGEVIYLAGEERLAQLQSGGVTLNTEDMGVAVKLPSGCYADRSLAHADKARMKRKLLERCGIPAVGDEAAPTLLVPAESLQAGMHLGSDEFLMPTSPVAVVEGDIRTDAVYPTAIRKIRPGNEDHLLNCYRSEGEFAVIRSGVVDTRAKALELHAVIMDTVASTDPSTSDAAPAREPRVLSCSLLNKGNEKVMIEAQHAEISQLAKEARDRVGRGVGAKRDYDIVHMNLQASAFVYWCRLPPFSWFVKGESYSADINLEAMSQYVHWFNKDHPDLAQEISTHHQYAVHRIRMNSLRARDASLTRAERKEARAQVKIDRAQLREALELVYGQLEQVGPDNRTAALLRSFIGSQLGKEKMSRGQEAMILQALNLKLGVTVAMNCKSGLDRTGWMYALTSAQQQMLKMGRSVDDVADLALDWDTNVGGVSGRLAGVTVENYGDQIRMALEDMTPDHPEKKVMEFRRLFLANLVEVGMPITFTSTGALGLKWGDSWMKRNRVPIEFLPVFAQDASDGRIRRLTEPATWGARLTADGQALILGHSDSRGG